MTIVNFFSYIAFMLRELDVIGGTTHSDLIHEGYTVSLMSALCRQQRPIAALTNFF